MKKLRVFQTVNHKRIVPGFSMKSPGAVLLFLLFLPYFVSVLFGNMERTEAGALADSIAGSIADSIEKQLKNGHMFVSNTTAMGKERIPLEIYVADKLARSIDVDYEKEALKAQAVLLRSGLLAQQEGRPPESEIVLFDEDYGSVPLPEKILQAAAETSGVYLSYDGKAIDGAYFAVSNGATRDGGELGLADHPYLKRVFCDRDFLSPDYSKTVSLKEKEYETIWEQCAGYQITEEEILGGKEVQVRPEAGDLTLYLDGAGYVLYAGRDGKFVSGEELRAAYMLPSASFRLEKEGEKIHFYVKGKGHGMGMSQFAANEMAKEGEDYVKILQFFFQDATISKFE